MNKLTFFLINRFSTGKTDHNNMQNILLKALIPGVLGCRSATDRYFTFSGPISCLLLYKLTAESGKYATNRV